MAKKRFAVLAFSGGMCPDGTAAINNLEWAVEKVIQREYPMRPHQRKCVNCDFRLLCSKRYEDFTTAEGPLPIHIPREIAEQQYLVKAFSEVDA